MKCSICMCFLILLSFFVKYTEIRKCVTTAKYDYFIVIQYSVMLSFQSPQRHTHSMFRVLAAAAPPVQYQSVDLQKKKKKLQSLKLHIMQGLAQQMNLESLQQLERQEILGNLCMNSYNELIVGNGFFTFFQSYIMRNTACVIRQLVNIILCADGKGEC